MTSHRRRIILVSCLILSACYPRRSDAGQAKESEVLWISTFETDLWFQQWHAYNDKSWGWSNIQIPSDPEAGFHKFLRVHFRKEAMSIQQTVVTGAPRGGLQLFADLGIQPSEFLHLSYYVRFADDFDFSEGGKLPGLFGGGVFKGQNITDDSNMFSVQLGWRSKGDGELFVSPPGNPERQISLGKGRGMFDAGEWRLIEEEVMLNTPGQPDGTLRVWIDNQLVLEKTGLTFRTQKDQKLQGILFAALFDDPDAAPWSLEKPTHIDFANFVVRGNPEP